MADTVESVEVVKQEIAPVVAQANQVVISDAASNETAIAFLKSIKAAQKKVSDFFEPLKSAAHKAWKQTTESEAQLLDPLKLAEKSIKDKSMTWQRQQEEARQAEQRRLQAIADEAARRERERLEKEAAKLKTPELKAARLAQAEAVTTPVVEVAKTVGSTSGTSIKKLWKARVVNADAVPREWLMVNETALAVFAKSTKGSVKVAGVEFYAEDSMAVSTR
jgi:hypothetical protein